MVSQNFYAAGAHGSELLIPTQIIQIVLRCISVHLNVPFESLAPPPPPLHKVLGVILRKVSTTNTHLIFLIVETCLQ